MFTREEKIKLMKSLMWDYKYSPEECLEVLEGKRKTVGHYNEKTLFRKLIESYHWFTILKILDLKRISELLSDDVIQSLRMPSMRKAYQYVRKKLP